MSLWRQLGLVWTVAIGATVILLAVDQLSTEGRRSYFLPMGVGGFLRYLLVLFHTAPLAALALFVPLLAFATTIALVVWRLARGTT